MASKEWEPAYEYKNNPHYIKFTELKERIKQKYPQEIFELSDYTGKSIKQINKETREYEEKYRHLHLQYLRELADLIFQPDGEFQLLTWDMISEVEQKEMERRARGRKMSRDYLGE